MRQHNPPLTFADLDSGALPAEKLPRHALARLTDDYRPWRKVRYLAAELEIDPVEAWGFVKSQRRSNWQSIPVEWRDGANFGYCATPHLLEPIFRIDRATGDRTSDQIQAPVGRHSRLIAERWQAIVRRSEYSPVRIGVRTLMEEAAESSIMEGAATTRKEAIELLRAGRPPRNRGERMVLNNFQAMQQIKEWLERPLSVELLLELQEILVEGTLDDPSGAGRLRRDDEAVRIVDTREESVLFVPPPVANLPGLLRQICDFANSEHAGPEFIHPLIKASVLHFLIGYAHPFVDGNGRTARAVFYWSALRSGYGIFEYLAISEVIRKGFARYPQAYLDTELDDGDLTYFVLYKLDVIRQSLDRLAMHLKREQNTIERSQRLLAISSGLNLRQRLLLEHALRHPLTHYTVNSHRNSNGIATNTARADLEDLVKRRLMTTTRKGKQVIYLASAKLAERLAESE